MLKFSLYPSSLAEAYHNESIILKDHFYAILNHYKNDTSDNSLEINLKLVAGFDPWLKEQCLILNSICRYKSLIYWYICESSIPLNEDLLLFLLRHNFQFNIENSEFKIDDFLFRNKLIDKINFLIDNFSYRFSSRLVPHLIFYAQTLDPSDSFRNFILFNIERYSGENETRFTIALKYNLKDFYKQLLEENTADIMKRGSSGSPLELMSIHGYFEHGLIDFTINQLYQDAQKASCKIDLSFFWPKSLRGISEKNLHDVISKTSFSQLSLEHLMIDSTSHIISYCLENNYKNLLTFILSKFENELNLSTLITDSGLPKTITQIAIEQKKLTILIITLLLEKNLLDISHPNFNVIALKLFQQNEIRNNLNIESYLSICFERNQIQPMIDYLKYHKISLTELSTICGLGNIVFESIQRDKFELMKFFILNFKHDPLMTRALLHRFAANCINNNENSFLEVILENYRLDKNTYIEGLSLVAICIIRDNFSAFELLVEHDLINSKPFEDLPQLLADFIIENNAEVFLIQKDNSASKKIMNQLITELLSKSENNELIFEKLLKKQKPCHELAKKTFEVFFNRISSNNHHKFLDRVPVCINLGIQKKIINPNRQITGQISCIDYVLNHASLEEIVDFINYTGEFFSKIKIYSHSLWLNLLEKDPSGFKFIEIIKGTNPNFRPKNLLNIIEYLFLHSPIHHIEWVLEHLDKESSILSGHFYELLEKLVLTNQNSDLNEKIIFLWSKKPISEHAKWIKTLNKKNVLLHKIESIVQLPKSPAENTLSANQHILEEPAGITLDNYSFIIRNALQDPISFSLISNINPYEPLNIELIHIIKREILSSYFNENPLLMKKVFNNTLFRQVIQNETFDLLDRCIGRELNESLKSFLQLFKKKYIENINTELTKIILKDSTKDIQKLIILQELHDHLLISEELLELIKKRIPLEKYPETYQFLYAHYASAIPKEKSPRTIYLEKTCQAIKKQQSLQEIRSLLNQLRDFPEPLLTASDILDVSLSTNNEEMIFYIINYEYYLMACLLLDEQRLLKKVLTGNFSDKLKTQIQQIPLIRSALEPPSFIEQTMMPSVSYNEDPLLFYFEQGSFFINPKTGNYLINEIQSELLSRFVDLISKERNPFEVRNWLRSQKNVLKYMDIQFLFFKLLELNHQQTMDLFLSLLEPINKYLIFKICLNSMMDHQRAESIMCFILDDVEISNFINTDPYQELIIVSFVKTGYYNCLYRLMHNQHLEKPCLQLSLNCLAHFFGAISEYKFKIATLIFERFHPIFETKADELAEYLRESSPYIKAKSIEIIKKNSSCKELLALIEQLSYKKQKSVSTKGREATTVIFSKQGSSEIDEQKTSQKKSPSENSLRK